MFRKIVSFCAIVVSIFAIDNNIDVNRLQIDDLGSFFVKKLHLTNEEARLSADKLSERGLAIYNTPGEVRTMSFQNGKTFTYRSSQNKKAAMKYLIAAGLLGNVQAAVTAMSYLNLDGSIPGAKSYRLALAKVLSKNGYLYGTYILGMNYANGGINQRNRDLALYNLGIVKDYCKNSHAEAIQSLVTDKIFDTDDKSKLDILGNTRCRLAISFYNNIKNTTYTIKTPISYNKKKAQALQEAFKRILVDKQSKAINRHLQSNK